MKLKVLLYYLFFVGCNNPTGVEVQNLDNVSFIVNLPKDNNGYFLLTLDRSSPQTVHNIHGEIYPPVEYKRFEWSSNLSFFIGPYVANTTNIRSYTDKNGEFTNTIGPVLEMVGDTMKLKVKWDSRAQLDDMYFYEPNQSEIFYIILQ